MPLEAGAKPGSPGFSRNVATEVRAGKPVKQAAAIAYAKARKDADGGDFYVKVRVKGGGGTDQRLVRGASSESDARERALHGYGSNVEVVEVKRLDAFGSGTLARRADAIARRADAVERDCDRADGDEDDAKSLIRSYGRDRALQKAQQLVKEAAKDPDDDWSRRERAKWEQVARIIRATRADAAGSGIPSGPWKGFRESELYHINNIESEMAGLRWEIRQGDKTPAEKAALGKKITEMDRKVKEIVRQSKARGS